MTTFDQPRLGGHFPSRFIALIEPGCWLLYSAKVDKHELLVILVPKHKGRLEEHVLLLCKKSIAILFSLPNLPPPGLFAEYHNTQPQKKANHPFESGNVL